MLPWEALLGVLYNAPCKVATYIYTYPKESFMIHCKAPIMVNFFRHLANLENGASNIYVWAICRPIISVHPITCHQMAFHLDIHRHYAFYHNIIYHTSLPFFSKHSIGTNLRTLWLQSWKQVKSPKWTLKPTQTSLIKNTHIYIHYFNLKHSSCYHVPPQDVKSNLSYVEVTRF